MTGGKDAEGGRDSGAAAIMKGLAGFSLAAAAIGALLYRRTGGGGFLTLAVTFGTVFYHLGFRLAAGWLFGRLMGNRADCSRRWFRPRPWEDRLYRRLGVKRWKNRLPTYHPPSFSPGLHTWDEIAQATCQAELVHETNALLSFLPVLAGRRLGGAAVFWITSVLAACFDLVFVIVQRYNRPRILRLALGTAGKRKNETYKMDGRYYFGN